MTIVAERHTKDPWKTTLIAQEPCSRDPYKVHPPQQIIGCEGPSSLQTAVQGSDERLTGNHCPIGSQSPAVYTAV